jgi:hypothetical protein
VPTTALLVAFSLVPLVVPFAATALPAQGVLYEIDPANSHYLTGCAGPSICLCPVAAQLGLSGSFRLVPLLPQLGPIFEYSVVDFEAGFGPGSSPAIAGSGLYTIDLAANTQTVVIDGTVDGIPATFETIGAIEVIVPFPGSLQFDVYRPVSPPCLYEGMAISAAPAAGVSFIRGDANEDGSLDISDVVSALGALFPAPGQPVIDCLDAADANDDGTFNIADPIALLGGLFGSGGDPAPPFPGCGVDPTADGIGCAGHDSCP